MKPSDVTKRNRAARKKAAADLAERSAKSIENAALLEMTDEQEIALDRALRLRTAGRVLNIYAVNKVASVVQGGLPGLGKKR